MRPAGCVGTVSGDFSKHLGRHMLFHIPHSNEISHRYVGPCEFVNIAWLSNSDHRCDKGSFSLHWGFIVPCVLRSWHKYLVVFHTRCKHLITCHCCGWTFHGGEGTFSCEICGKVKNTERFMKCHMISHRVGVLCNKCGKSFKTEESCRSHDRNSSHCVEISEILLQPVWKIKGD